MNGMQAAARLVDAFEAATIDYMVVGSLSSSFYGIARSTYDADFVVDASVAEMQRAISGLGSDFRMESQLSFEMLTGTTRRVIHLRDSSFVIELFQLSRDPFDIARFQRKVRKQLPVVARVVFVPTAEDVIIMKLKWGRPKDLDDVRGVIAVQSNCLDWDYIHQWTAQHGTQTRLDQIRTALPPSD